LALVIIGAFIYFLRKSESRKAQYRFTWINYFARGEKSDRFSSLLIFLSYPLDKLDETV
jgi:hypothetical protein